MDQVQQEEKNGRLDMKALRAHYRGEGNQSRRIGEAERLRNTLHYKSEGALSFSIFVSKCQHMFNLFEQADEPYTDAMKLRFLTEKVQNIALQPTIEAIKSSVALDPQLLTISLHKFNLVIPPVQLVLLAQRVDPLI